MFRVLSTLVTLGAIVSAGFNGLVHETVLELGQKHDALKLTEVHSYIKDGECSGLIGEPEYKCIGLFGHDVPPGFLQVSVLDKDGFPSVNQRDKGLAVTVYRADELEDNFCQFRANVTVKYDCFLF